VAAAVPGAVAEQVNVTDVRDATSSVRRSNLRRLLASPGVEVSFTVQVQTLAAAQSFAAAVQDGPTLVRRCRLNPG